VCLDDLSRLIDGQDLVVAQAAGAEDNVMEFFSTHPSVQQMIYESEPASSGAGVYVVATEIRSLDWGLSVWCLVSGDEG